MNKSQRTCIWLLIAGLLVLRVILWQLAQSNWDIQTFYLPWQNFLIDHGRWRALRSPIGDYFPAYYECMALISYLDGSLDRIIQIKLLSFLFDIVAAGIAFRLVGALTQDNVTKWVAPFCVLAGPTVIVNGAIWGQCDIVYTTFLLLTVFAFVIDNDALAMLAFGFALSFKLQSIFLCPFLLAMLLQKRIRLKALVLLPLGWLFSIVPPLLAGGSAWAWLGAPLKQSGEISALSVNVGNIWVFGKLLHVSQTAGTILGAVLTMCVGIAIGVFGSRFRQTKSIVVLASLSLICIPYVMPRVHDRYFMPAELLLCLLACVDLAFALPAGLLLTGSLISYACYFQAAYRHWAMGPAFLMNTAALFLVVMRAYHLRTDATQCA